MDADAALLKELLTSPIAYHPVFARVAGSAATGLFLSQLYYWSQRASHPDGWVYKDAGAWQEETRLTVQEQRTARRDLTRLGLLSEGPAHKFFSEISAFDKKLCFKLNIALLYEFIWHKKQQNTPPSPENTEGAISTDRAEISEDHIIVPQACAVTECAISTARKNKASAKTASSSEKQQFTQHRVPQTPPTTTTSVGSGGDVEQTPKSKTPALRAGVQEAGQKTEEALQNVSLAECCEQYQQVLANAAAAAGLDSRGTQKLADALAGALQAPEGDRGRLKNRSSPSRWLQSTAIAISNNEFNNDSYSYQSARAARQARAAEMPKETEEAERRRQQLLNDVAAAAGAGACKEVVIASKKVSAAAVDEAGKAMLRRIASKRNFQTASEAAQPRR